MYIRSLCSSEYLGFFWLCPFNLLPCRWISFGCANLNGPLLLKMLAMSFESGLFLMTLSNQLITALGTNGYRFEHLMLVYHLWSMDPRYVCQQVLFDRLLWFTPVSLVCDSLVSFYYMAPKETPKFDSAPTSTCWTSSSKGMACKRMP